MIHGIGTDIVRIARMQKDLERYGARFAERILNEAELKEFAASSTPARLLAKRFAAKEAAAKALGTGFRDGLALRDIGVDHDALGKPLLTWRGYAVELRERLGLGESFLSLADEEEYAVAYVVLVKQGG